MTTIADIRKRLATLLAQTLDVEAPPPDAELIESGFLDSLQLVELLAALEQTFGVSITAEDLDLENFRTLDRLAAFVSRRCKVAERT
jgi:acyl carrier protein